MTAPVPSPAAPSEPPVGPRTLATPGAGRPGAGSTAVEPLAGRRVTVMGLGLFGGGVGAARWLVRQGARVVVTDLRDAATLAPALGALAGLDIEVHLGPHTAADFEGAEFVVANPAVAPSNPWLRRAREHGARITSEVELFLERCPAPCVAVTGTQGKSSTATWIAHLAAPVARRVHLGGNIGGSLVEALADVRAEDLVVLELSSYQLEALPPPGTLPAHARAVVVTNVVADHLERHGDVAEYARAKARVLELVERGGLAVLPAEWLGRPPFHRAAETGATLVAHGALRAAHGVEASLGVRGGRFVVGTEDLGPVAALRVPGAFQRENVALALGVARHLGVAVEDLRALVPTLVGLPHRVSELGSRSGVRVIDNGVSTTPDSTLAALDSLAEEPGDADRPLTVLLGGAPKRDLALDELAARLAARGALAVAFGAAAEALAAACAAAGARCITTPEVLGATAVGLAETPRGGTLLFSPACASFDAWPNFEARARAFQAALPPRDGEGVGLHR
jgi:UDP-N-acetylmuramoylalanine--D-glutamate ligase